MKWYDPIEQRWHDPQPAPPRELTEEERVREELNRIDHEIRKRHSTDIWRAVVSTANGTTAKPSEPSPKPTANGTTAKPSEPSPKPKPKKKLCHRCFIRWDALMSNCMKCGRSI